jgi:ethanolamine utilization protein EutQ (cupin superfamily)
MTDKILKHILDRIRKTEIAKKSANQIRQEVYKKYMEDMSKVNNSNSKLWPLLPLFMSFKETFQDIGDGL